MREPLPAHASGPTATLNVLEAARQAGVRRVMFAASSSAYGDTDEVPRGAGTGGSRSLQSAGAAVWEASGQLVERARQLAADTLEASVDARKRALAEASHVRPISGEGPGALSAKLREEVTELAHALEAEGDERVVSEAADTIYEVVVALRARSISVRRVLAELARRLGRGRSDDSRSLLWG